VSLYFLQRDGASLLRGLGNDPSGGVSPTLQTVPVIWPTVSFGAHQTLKAPPLPTAFYAVGVAAPVPALTCAAVELRSVGEVHLWSVRCSAQATVLLDPITTPQVRPFVAAATANAGCQPWGATPQYVVQSGTIGAGGLLTTNIDNATLVELLNRGFNRVPPGHRLVICALVANTALTVHIAASDIGPVIEL